MQVTWPRAALAALLTGILGFVMGASRPAMTVETGVVHAVEGAISIETPGWTYGVPIGGVRWEDATGRLHEDGRPDCLQPTNDGGRVTFGWMVATVGGTSWRPVAWVSCR